MSIPLRVVAVVQAPLEAVEQAARSVPAQIRSSAVMTPAGVVLTLERRAGWRRAGAVRELETVLRAVLERVG